MKILKKENGFSHEYLLAVIVIAVIALIGVKVYLATHASNACRPDPTAYIQSLPAGSVWNGKGDCYTLADFGGITITKPITVENATFTDPQPFYHGTNANSFNMKPIIHIKNANDVTLSNLTLNGDNVKGGYHALPWVGQEGIKINGATNVTIDNVATNNTFGDGMLVDNTPGVGPSNHITVNSMTIGTTGREGITIALVTNSTFNDVNIQGPTAYGGWDFESDVEGQGASNITINNPSGPGGGVRMIEDLEGPVTVNNSAFNGGVWVSGEAASESGQTVTFNGGELHERCGTDGVHQSGLQVGNGTNVPNATNPAKVVVENMTLDRQTCAGNKSPTAPAWNVTRGGVLKLKNVQYVAPTGYNDSASTVIQKNVTQIPYNGNQAPVTNAANDGDAPPNDGLN